MLEELYEKYDKLQRKYGDKKLHSIYFGGKKENPSLCFVFMNPTAGNVAAEPTWDGPRYPWLGTKNVWKLFYKLELLDKDIFEEIQKRKPIEWNEEFADLVYKDVEKHKFFITNLGKCTQVDARPLPDSVYQEYLDLLCKEIELIKPKIIITLGNQVSSIVLNQKISVSQCRKSFFKKEIAGNEYKIYPVYYPIGNGMMNIDKAIQDIKFIIKENIFK